MSKYESLMKRLTEMHQLMNEMQDIVYLGQSLDAVDARIFDTVIGMYLKIGVQIEEFQKIVSGMLLCKNDSDRLEFFIKNILNKEK